MRILKKAALFLGVSCAATGATAAVAQAQTADAGLTESRNVSVRERSRPEYDPLGVRAGAFMLYPSLDLGVTFDDNIFATPTNEQDDTIYSVAAAARLLSNWSVHELALFATTNSRFHNDFSALDTTDWTAGADGRLDIVRGSYLTGSFSYTDAFEPLYENPNIGLREPVEYSLVSGDVGGQWGLARTRIGVFAGIDTYDFEDGRLFNNAVVNQDDRDRSVTEAGGRVDFSVSPDTALFASAEMNWHDYDQMPPSVPINRNSEGYEALVGVNFDLTRLLRGEIGVGYMHQEYDAAIADSDGFAGNAKIEWFPTEIFTVTGMGSRFVGDAGLTGAASYIGTRYSLGADYEFLRNVIFSAEGAFYQEEYQGINREDDRWRTQVGVEYKLNRVLATYAQYTHWDQDSSGTAPGRIYQESIGTIGVRLRR